MHIWYGSRWSDKSKDYHVMLSIDQLSNEQVKVNVGRPSSISSFKFMSKDQPSTTKGHNCGRMNITSLTEDYTWDLIPCDEPLASYAGCELPYRSRIV